MLRECLNRQNHAILFIIVRKLLQHSYERMAIGMIAKFSHSSSLLKRIGRLVLPTLLRYTTVFS
jgi:hypothetical protein